LDSNLVATVMQIESCGDPNARSHAGAIGLFQVMPYHFEPTDSPYKPSVNAKRGLNYLQLALAEYNNPSLAFAGYNGGIGTAAKPKSLWPAETIRYTHWGSNIYADAKINMRKSDTLNVWLESGGASLCAQANVSLGLSP
ncbi:MAG: lytic transglycosylase domain-containing protein, partial [Chloroflexota bacterium]